MLSSRNAHANALRHHDHTLTHTHARVSTDNTCVWPGDTSGIPAMTSMWDFTVFVIKRAQFLHQVQRSCFPGATPRRHSRSAKGATQQVTAATSVKYRGFFLVFHCVIFNINLPKMKPSLVLYSLCSVECGDGGRPSLSPSPPRVAPAQGLEQITSDIKHMAAVRKEKRREKKKVFSKKKKGRKKNRVDLSAGSRPFPPSLCPEPLFFSLCLFSVSGWSKNSEKMESLASVQLKANRDVGR